MTWIFIWLTASIITAFIAFMHLLPAATPLPEIFLFVFVFLFAVATISTIGRYFLAGKGRVHG